MRAAWPLIIVMALAPLLAMLGGAMLPAQDPINTTPRMLVLFQPGMDPQQAFATLTGNGRPIAQGRAGTWLVAAEAGQTDLAPALYRAGAWLVLDAESWLAGCFTRSV